jgi:hypothetical protein
MIARIVLRSLATRPLRTLVLATGFGLAVGVMAELLGVGEVILEQAHSPALGGGGDAIVAGTLGSIDSARFVLSNVIGAEPLRRRVRVASPSRRAALFLITPSATVPINVRAGIPTLEKAVGDPEVSGLTIWSDAPGDAKWSAPDQGEILRAMDRFHPVPPSVVPSPVVSGRSRTEYGGHDFDRSSWAEWLYFNGRSSDGRLRFYVTFLTGAPSGDGNRPALVRLQLDRSGRSSNYSAVASVDERGLLQHAPDLDVGNNHVRLEGLRYHLMLDLAQERSTAAPAPSPESRLRAEITLDAQPGRSLPPGAIQGAHGWVSGYVAPVLSGTINGWLTARGERIQLAGLAGYHDHNWGFWEGVRWQWGQVAHGDISIIYGRVFPPETVADPDRIPGVVGVLGPDGPIGFSTHVGIEEQEDARGPGAVTIHATGEQLDVELAFSVEESVRTRLGLTASSRGTAMDFLQLGGVYKVTGHAGSRSFSFKARGSAETFRPGR